MKRNPYLCAAVWLLVILGGVVFGLAVWHATVGMPVSPADMLETVRLFPFLFAVCVLGTYLYLVESCSKE